MDIKLSGITQKAEQHAELLAFFLGAYARANEAGNNLSNLIGYMTFQQAWNPLKEVQLTLQGGTDGVIWKLWKAPHTPQMLVKLGLAIYGAGYLGVLGKKWENIGKKVAIGGGIAGFIMPGSGSPGPSNGNMSQGATGIKGY